MQRSPTRESRHALSLADESIVLDLDARMSATNLLSTFAASLRHRRQQFLKCVQRFLREALQREVLCDNR